MDTVKPLKYALAAGAVAGTLLLSGCADPLNWGSAFAPKPSAGTPRPSVTSGPATSGVPSQAPSSQPPSASSTPSAVTAKASGSMKLYANEVSRRFTGTCTTSDTIKIAAADHANDFYGTVDVTVVLDSDATQVNSMLAVFGEDSEGITRKISYRGDAPAKGTSAKLTAAGQRYQLSGNGLATETRNGKDTNRLIPYALDLTCTGS
jgi:hypothetical protein